MASEAEGGIPARPTISRRYAPARLLILIAALGLSMTAQPVPADTISAAEIAEQIVDRDLVAWRMGM